MVLLVDPAQSGLGLVVEDASVVGPGAGGAGTGKKVLGGGDLEQEALLEQEVSLLVG